MSQSKSIITTLKDDPIFARFLERNNLDKQTYEITLFDNEIFEFKRGGSFKELQRRENQVSEFAESWHKGLIGPALKELAQAVDDDEAGHVAAYLDSLHTRRWEIERTQKLDENGDPYEEIKRVEVPRFEIAHWLMMAIEDGHAFGSILRAVNKIGSTLIDANLAEAYTEAKKESTAATPSTS